MRAVLPVERRGTLDRIRLLPELLALGRRPCGQWTRGGSAIEIALAGNGALAADVQRLERVQLLGIRNADAEPDLLVHARIGNGRLHPAELQRQPLVLVEVRKDRR